VNRIPVSSLNDKKSNLNVKNPRCLELFLNSCKNNATRETYVNHFNAFLKHVGKDPQSLLMLSDSELNIILVDYVMFCSSNDRYTVSSIRGIIASIDKFLFMNDRTINKKKLLMFLPEQKNTAQRAITTEEILLYSFKEILLYSFEEILSVKMAESDIGYRKYELNKEAKETRYPVLSVVPKTTYWFD